MKVFTATTFIKIVLVRLRQASLSVVVVSAGILLGAPIASAEVGPGDTIESVCMDDWFPGTLGCTANDVRVSGVADVGTNLGNGVCSDVGPDGIIDECDITFAPVCDVGAPNAGTDCSADPNICMDSNGNNAPMLCGDACAFLGDTTTFSATFEVVLGAQARYDIGMYFAIDGDPNGDGALTGLCSISTLPEIGSFTRPGGSTGNFVDLDKNCKGGRCPQPEDLCGDIDAANSPIFYDLSANNKTITTECIDTDGNGKLNLPNCTSWRQSGANEVCLDPEDAFPGSPSKCNCDPGFEVPINVPAAELQVVKTATPDSVNEPSGTVTFSIAVTNTGIDPNNNVTLNTLSDDIYGDITLVQGDILSTTCEVPQTVTPLGTYTCSFNATVSGMGDTSHTDTVTASGVDDQGNPISGSDDAVVTIADVLPDISVVKDAVPATVLEGSGTVVTFSVTVNNDSPSKGDALTLTSLTDTIYGDITQVQGGVLSTTCSLVTIVWDGSYSCSFTAVVDGPAIVAGEPQSETDTVTAVGVDDELNEVPASDSATVSILDDVAMIEVIKTADPTMINEPGEPVTYSFTVNNKSTVDTVTINILDDTIYGNLNGQDDCSTPQILAPEGSYSCSVTIPVTGDADDVIINVVTATGVDDDGKTVTDSDDATVNVKDVPPAASLTKTATMVVATFEVHVTNDSGAEALTLDSLVDDEFGDITVIQGDVLSTTCGSVPKSIVVGSSYTCTFEGKITESPHVDTVTGTISDNDDNTITESDDAEVTFGNPAP